MRQIWLENSTSIKSKSTIHWIGNAVQAACGIPLDGQISTMLVESITCERCQRKASEEWKRLHYRRAPIDENEEEE